MENSSAKFKRKLLRETVYSLQLFFWFIFVVYPLPAIICLIINFMSFVVFGDNNLSHFDWKYHSYQQVNIFYSGIFRWLQDFIYRLKH